jgi:serine/threonine protein kinase
VTDQPTTAMPAERPRVVGGRYRLLDLCGRGGTAEVWRAQDESLDRVVALKLVTVPTDEGAQRAGEEARLLARLNHPSLVPVYDAGTDADDHPWVVMELVEGETLGDTIRRGPIEPRRTAEVGQAVAAALAYVHAQNLVHRDVKPGNVLIGHDGRVRLTDFGIARLVDAAKVTATGLTVGTASYLAPEQVLGERVGPQADVYALGLVLLECLTGRREYAGSTVEVALARLNRSPEVSEALPSGWPQLLRAMTDNDPQARPVASEVAEELARIAAGGAATTLLAGPPPADRTQVLDATRLAATAPPPAVARTVAAQPARPVPVPPRSNDGAKWAVALVAIVALLAGGFLLNNLRGGDEGSPPPAISENLPPQLRTDLKNLQDEIESVG